MLPSNGEFTPEPIPSDWYYKYPTEFDPLVDYEIGGVDLQDASQGLEVGLWKISYGEGMIRLGKVSEQGTYKNLTSATKVTRVALCFDQNMTPCYAWQEGEDFCYLVFYDSQSNKTTRLTFEGIKDPCLTLDDHRRDESGNSDMIFAYVKDEMLCYRQQRDRFEIEYVKTPISGELIRVGMSVNSRLQFVSRFHQRPNEI